MCRYESCRGRPQHKPTRQLQVMGDQEELEKEVLREFLVESEENLSRLDQEMVELERQPRNTELLGSVFRTIHTLKGTCGFFGFTRLDAIAHLAESILGELRGEQRILNSSLAGLILEAVDAIKTILSSIQSGNGEGPPFESAILARLQAELQRGSPQSGQASIPATVTSPVLASYPEAVAPLISGPSAADSTLRIDVNTLDRLMNLVGELVLTRNQLLQYRSTRH